jgi:hypothetical protein
LGRGLVKDSALGEEGHLVGDGSGEIHGVGDEDEGAAF